MSSSCSKLIPGISPKGIPLALRLLAVATTAPTAHIEVFLCEPGWPPSGGAQESAERDLVVALVWVADDRKALGLLSSPFPTKYALTIGQVGVQDRRCGLLLLPPHERRG